MAYRPSPDALSGSDNADDVFPHPIFKPVDQDSCHRRRSGNLLNLNRFQFKSLEPFCPLPFMKANFAYEKGRVLPQESPWRLTLFPVSGSLAPSPRVRK
jgi:hypothetical protein